MRSPLALLKVRGSWVVAQTANAARGQPADEVVFVRKPTAVEEHTVMATLAHAVTPKKAQLDDLMTPVVRWSWLG